ncbi:MAG: hypothetical protein KDK65_06300 [Chlamydiia bacterium]|nr:hypothetical protein [Chlamydiia bacterium]
MHEKLRLWDEQAAAAAAKRPLKGLKQLPKMVGITTGARRFLKGKSLLWMVRHDQGGRVFREILRHPVRYFLGYMRALWRGKAYERDGDFFFYGIDGEKAFRQELQKKETLPVLGFSYCHKPFECPSGRFNDQCIHDPNHRVCQQCFIGKAANLIPNVHLFIIPTIHYIGEKMLKLKHQNPNRKLLFAITACELTLEMFGDWGNMAALRGIGIRLDGRICNTMQAFALSERGIKPGLTVVTEATQARLLRLFLPDTFPLT